MRVLHTKGLDEAPRAEGHVVVIDVLRAFTVAAHAFGAGAEAIVLVATREEGLRLHAARPDLVLIGEHGGRRMDGFHHGNSPEIRHLDLRGRTLVQRTGSGTRNVVGATRAREILLGSLPVASATARYLRRAGADPVTLHASRSPPGGPDGDEDDACADLLDALLAGSPPPIDEVVRRVRTCPAADEARDPTKPWIVEADVDLAAHVDRFDFAMRVMREHGLLVARRVDLPAGADPGADSAAARSP